MKDRIMVKRYVTGSLALGCIVLAMSVVHAATTGSGPEKSEMVMPPVYRPVMSDLMNSIIQPRHIKLWLAGKDRNWAYADYELHNLQGAFARMAVAIPLYRDKPVTDMLDAFTKEQIADVGAAINAKDEAGFTKAYSALTDGCNSCHQSGDHSMVVIKEPDAAAFPDQEFGPAKP
jgi:hypothetical protein